MWFTTAYRSYTCRPESTSTPRLPSLTNYTRVLRTQQLSGVCIFGRFNYVYDALSGLELDNSVNRAAHLGGQSPVRVPPSNRWPCRRESARAGDRSGTSLAAPHSPPPPPCFQPQLVPRHPAFLPPITPPL